MVRDYLDGGATEADGRASASVDPDVAPSMIISKWKYEAYNATMILVRKCSKIILKSESV